MPSSDESALILCQRLAAAIHAAFVPRDFQQFLLFSLTRRMDDYTSTSDTWPQIVRKVLIAAARNSWLDQLVTEAAAAHLDIKDLYELNRVEIVSAICSALSQEASTETQALEQWSDKSTWDLSLPPALGISSFELATIVFGESENPAIERVKRAFRRDAGTMAYDKVPITGNKFTTGKITLSRMDVVYLQGPKAVVKLIRFVIPSDARQVRVPSNRRLDDELGPPFVPPTAAFVERDGAFVERQQNSVVPQAGQRLWPLSAKDAKGAFHTITYYDDIHFFPFDGLGDNTGAVIGDLAGKVDELYFTVGGCFGKLNFAGFYELPTTSPLAFRTINSSQLAPNEPQHHVESAFAPLLRHVQHLDASAIDTRPELKGAIDLWESARGHTTVWQSVVISQACNDVMIHLRGSFGV